MNNQIQSLRYDRYTSRLCEVFIWQSICENIKNQDVKKINFRFLTTYPETKKILEK